MGTMGTGPLYGVTCKFRAHLGPIHIRAPLLFNVGVLLCRPNFMAWWVRKYLIHDEKLKLLDSLMIYSKAFTSYQELPVERRIVIYA